MKRFLSIFLIVAALAQSTSAVSFKEAPELEKLFKERNVVGTFVLYDVAADTMFVWSDGARKAAFYSRVHFKIANSLVGLDVGAVKNVDEVLPYGGKPQRLKEWERDMGLREAIKISNVPIYQELARRIGLERMRESVKKLGYGNMEIGNVVDRFWLDGPLQISAVEQTEFLARLASGQLPINPKTVKAVKEITLQEKTDHYSLHGKTGWLFESTPQIGWYVGWVERGEKVYPFALNIDMSSEKDAAKRIPLARECLTALDKL